MSMKSFPEDFCNHIEKWQEEGDQMVILLDANEDVHSGEVKTAVEWRLLPDAII